jgi:hypothetical protein
MTDEMLMNFFNILVTEEDKESFGQEQSADL